MLTKENITDREGYKILEKYSQYVRGATSFVTDGDRTAWKSNAAIHVGQHYIVREFWRGFLGPHHWSIMKKGIDGYKEVVELEKKSGKDSAEGLKLFYQKLVENGLGTKEELVKFADKYISTHIVETTWDILRSTRKPKFLASVNGSSVAQAASDIFGFTNCASNQDWFDVTGRLKGVNITIRDGEYKVRAVHDMLKAEGLHLRDAVVIGNGINDIPMLEKARLSIASPFAIPEVMAVCEVHMESINIVTYSNLIYMEMHNGRVYID
ncbi:MAG: HAD hydrolase family protein [Candidatus Micrarchaeaceae archaeon]